MIPIHYPQSSEFFSKRKIGTQILNKKKIRVVKKKLPVIVPNIEQEIQEVAYFKWLKAGCPDGRDLEFWFAAENEIFHCTSEEEKQLFI